MLIGDPMTLLKEISALREELEAAKRSPASATKNAQEAGSDLSRSAEMGGSPNADAAALTRSLEAFVAQVAKDVEENPGTAALSAFVIGLLVGLALNS